MRVLSRNKVLHPRHAHRGGRRPAPGWLRAAAARRRLRDCQLLLDEPGGALTPERGGGPTPAAPLEPALRHRLGGPDAGHLLGRAHASAWPRPRVPAGQPLDYISFTQLHHRAHHARRKGTRPWPKPWPS
ncbi:MAG: hypothetical protein WKG07_41805 [Hymenobacter sp.]